jgi:ubiquinone/menaquinone biosynthesis C-methylase UbiE
MRFEWSRPIAAYFDSAATGYARSIDPVFRPLAQSLVDSSQLHSTDIVLDLGTGTGLVAKAASEISSDVLAIDFARAMVSIARQRFSGGLIQGDIHALPFASDTIDAALASFSFNSTDPAAALVEAYRVLRPSGRLMMQEWDAPDQISDLVSDLFAEYLVDDPLPELERLRDQMQQPIPWDDVESVEALRQLFVDTGFTSVDVQHLSPQVVLPDAETFLRYKLAWPIRAAELIAMSDEVRALCLSDLRENIAPYVQRETGQLIWQPNIIRIEAAK